MFPPPAVQHFISTHQQQQILHKSFGFINADTSASPTCGREAFQLIDHSSLQNY